MNYPSVLIEEAVNELSKFPGVGKKSAMRMVLHLLKQQEQDVIKLGEAVIKLRTQIKYCKRCGNVSDADICNICNNPKRNHHNICLVEDLRDVIAIENTSQYNGTYHVLGGLISPVNGVGPDDLNIASLVERIKTESGFPPGRDEAADAAARDSVDQRAPTEEERDGRAYTRQPHNRGDDLDGVFRLAPGFAR